MQKAGNADTITKITNFELPVCCFTSLHRNSIPPMISQQMVWSICLASVLLQPAPPSASSFVQTGRSRAADR